VHLGRGPVQLAGVRVARTPTSPGRRQADALRMESAGAEAAVVDARPEKLVAHGEHEEQEIRDLKHELRSSTPSASELPLVVVRAC